MTAQIGDILIYEGSKVRMSCNPPIPNHILLLKIAMEASQSKRLNSMAVGVQRMRFRIL